MTGTYNGRTIIGLNSTRVCLQTHACMDGVQLSSHDLIKKMNLNACIKSTTRTLSGAIVQSTNFYVYHEQKAKHEIHFQEY